MKLVVIRKRKERTREKFKGRINIIWCWLYGASLELCQKLCCACDPGLTENRWAKDGGRNVWKETRSGPKVREKEKEETVYAVPLWGKWKKKNKKQLTYLNNHHHHQARNKTWDPNPGNHSTESSCIQTVFGTNTVFYFTAKRGVQKVSLTESPISALMFCR